MSDYTPTTEDIKGGYAYACDYEDGAKYEDSYAEFDRWLAEVKAQAWEEGAKWAAVEAGATRDERNNWLVPSDNPYRQGENNE